MPPSRLVGYGAKVQGRNEVVRGLDKEFIDCEMVKAGDRDNDRDTDSDYIDDVVDDDGSGTQESMDD